SRRRHTRFSRDWSSDVCSSDLSLNLPLSFLNLLLFSLNLLLFSLNLPLSFLNLLLFSLNLLLFSESFLTFSLRWKLLIFAPESGQSAHFLTGFPVMLPQPKGTENIGFEQIKQVLFCL